MGIDVRWGAATHQGKVREQNEDALLAGPTIFSVADGMGGHAGGEVASATAIVLLSAVEDDEVDASEVRHVLERANAEILRKARTGEGPAGMGTTISGVALGSDATATVFNLGDSRVYRRRAGELEQLTDDHSLVGELVRGGELSAEAARSHPDRNIVTRALGLAEDIDPQLTVVDLAEGDRFLVCSDGLTDELTDEAIAQLLESVDGVEGLAQRVAEAALDAGGRDNVSVVIVDVERIDADDLDADTNPSEGVGRSDGRRASDLDDDTNPSGTTAASGVA